MWGDSAGLEGFGVVGWWYSIENILCGSVFVLLTGICWSVESASRSYAETVGRVMNTCFQTIFGCGIVLSVILVSEPFILLGVLGLCSLYVDVYVLVVFTSFHWLCRSGRGGWMLACQTLWQLPFVKVFEGWPLVKLKPPRKQTVQLLNRWLAIKIV